MSKQDELIQIFKEDTSGKNHAEAQLVLNNDLVSYVDITTEESIVCINGCVISDNLFSEYNAKIEMDIKRKSIFSTSCSCIDFEKNEFKKKNYCCKHLVATFYKALEDLVKHPVLNQGEILEDEVLKNKNSLLKELLGDESDKEEVKIEVYINRNEWNNKISAELKIGLKAISSNNFYIVKDINQLLMAYNNNIPINYSKNFTFCMKDQKLNAGDKRIIDFIKMLKEIEPAKILPKSGENYVEGKYINIPDYLVREFFELIKKHRVYLNEGFFGRPVETEIFNETPNIDFDLSILKDNYILKSVDGMPAALSSKNDVFLYGTGIYLPDYEFCYKIRPYLGIFDKANMVIFSNSEEEVILRSLIPELNIISENVYLSKAIKDKIVMGECEFNFYFDQIEKNIILTLKVKYGIYEFNIFEDCREKIIYRDTKAEKQVIAMLNGFGFEEAEKRFYFVKEDDEVFHFFKHEIGKLQDIGEVYYSENFKGIKSIGPKGIVGDIKAGKYNYFEMDFKIDDIPYVETAEILRAFRDNLKYYKLKSGEYLDLHDLEINKILKILDLASTEDIYENHINISKARAAYIATYIEENDMRYIKGKTQLNEVKNKLKDIEKAKFTLPAELKASLRTYQKVGYNWFKTLDYLGLGGILGDEMGLGKTIQTITFILSNIGSKNLIVAPTSLIYNWLSEFEKFAPSVRVTALNGPKEDREEKLRNIGDYDVIVTTYNLLKRDLPIYNTMEFDYCIIDEAQNIKNANSQNAMAVKEIKAKNRFALSGTPIENSLMELWSIFDFVMPGYLYDEKRFSVRYHKKLRESPEVLEELNRLIKPFILRRRKKEVIKELPDKIEKNLLVNLNEEQQIVYKTYANYAVELIEKKVKEDEFKNSKIEILAYITKLRQLCLDPSVAMEDYTGGSGKLEALVELLHKCIEEGHRILLFSQFTSVLKNIGKRLRVEEITFSYLDGAIASEKRMEIVKAFNEGESSVFLISLKAGGTGLNLTSADVVIHFDPWWNPAVEEQATDRAHRIGQKNVVEVIKIIAKGTIEEKIISLQEEKKKLISELMGDELSSGEGFAALTEEELLGLFEVN